MKIEQDNTFSGRVTSVVTFSAYRTEVRVTLSIHPHDMTVKIFWNVRVKGRAPEVGEEVTIRFEVESRTGTSRWVIVPEEYVSPGGNPCSEVHLKEEGVCNLSTSTMSHDRVRFFISDGYYNDGYKRGSMRSVLAQAFGMTGHQSGQYMTGAYGGFFIVCRPSQFARFLIFRNEAGIKNGFMDLQATLYVPEPPRDIYTILAEKAGITRDQAKRGALALGFSGRRALEDQMGETVCDGPPEIDVSRNKYEPR